jgi:hypothetical protein
MNLPTEIRHAIFRAILVKNDPVRIECDYAPDGLYVTRTQHVNKGVVNFLSTCNEVAEEGTDIMYGQNEFECYHTRAMRKFWITGGRFGGIGAKNAAKIKRVVVGLPLVIIRNDQDFVGGNQFMDFAYKYLVGLQSSNLRPGPSIALASQLSKTR